MKSVLFFIALIVAKPAFAISYVICEEAFEDPNTVQPAYVDAKNRLNSILEARSTSEVSAPTLVIQGKIAIVCVTVTEKLD